MYTDYSKFNLNLKIISWMSLYSVVYVCQGTLLSVSNNHPLSIPLSENTEQMALNLPLNIFMHMKFLSFWSHIYYLCLWQAIESQPKGSLAYLLCFQHQLLPPLENRTGSTEPGNETLNFYPDMKVAHTDRWVFNQFT